MICVLDVQRKQQDSCEREEQLLIEGWRVGFVTGKPTLVEISVDDYDNNCIILFSVNTKNFHSAFCLINTCKILSTKQFTGIKYCKIYEYHLSVITLCLREEIQISYLTLFVPMCSIFYTKYLYFHLTHLLLPLKVHSRQQVSALSSHHQVLL